MRGKIGLEEHFAIPETLDDSRGFFPDRKIGRTNAINLFKLGMK